MTKWNQGEREHVGLSLWQTLQLFQDQHWICLVLLCVSAMRGTTESINLGGEHSAPPHMANSASCVGT